MPSPPSFNHLCTTARTYYAEHGVICLRQIVDAQTLELTRQGIDTNRQQPGPFFRDQTRAGDLARYVFDYWNWPHVASFRTLVQQHPFSALIADLLQAEQLFLLMDNWFEREASASNGAPWHHDEPYFDFQHGNKCILWYPLQHTKASEGLTFLSGSQNRERLLTPQHFRDHQPFSGNYADYQDWHDDIATEHDHLNWDIAPGDCLIFNFRTIHRVASNSPGQHLQTRMTFRYGDQGVRFIPRGEWTQEISDHLKAQGQVTNQAMSTPLTPQIWPSFATPTPLL